MLTMRGSALLIAVTASALGSPDCDTFTTCATCSAARSWSGAACRWCPLAGDEAASIEGVTDEFIDAVAARFMKGQSNYDQSVKDMQISLFSYSKVLTKVVLDTAPKLVWSELMHKVNVELSAFVKDALSDHGTLETLMAEDHVKASKRKRQELTVTRFKESLKILRSIK